MLSVLDELFVHYAYCDGVDDAEKKMLKAFADRVTPEAREKLGDSERVMPFANLEYPPGNRKRHGISGAKAPRAQKPRQPSQTAEPAGGRSEARAPIAEPSDAAVTQIIRPGDLSNGIIRVPKATKGLFPDSKGRINVELRGDDLGDCRWDPRIGPNQDRSGAIGIGRAAAGRLIAGEQLVVEQTDAGVRLT